MNISGTPRNKKQTKNNQQNKQIVVCPNCKHHFKVTLTEVPIPIDKIKIITEKDMSQSYENVSLQNSRQRTVDWKQISILKATEQFLIQSLKNTQFTTIQKLKKLNDLNQLKKSRLIMAQNKMFPSLQEAKSFEIQRQKIERQPISERQEIVEQMNDFPKQANLDHRQIDSQAIIEQGLQKNMIIQTLDCILQWIQAFELEQALPSFLKQMVQNYYLQNKKYREFIMLS